MKKYGLVSRPGLPIAIVGTGAILAAALIAPRPAAAQQVINSVVASVDGNPITSRDIQLFKTTNGAAVSGSPGNASGAASTTNLNDSKAVLKALITQQMLQNEAQKYSDRIDDSQVNNYIANLEQHAHINDTQLRSELRTQGVTYDEFRANVRKQLEAMAMIDKEVRQKIVIPDSEIEAYYKAHPEEFQVKEEKYKLAQILIALPPDATTDQVAAARKKADEVRKKAVNGGDFAFLASEYSDDDSKTKGGELGYFAPGDLLDSITNGIAGLKPGAISPVIRSKYGFHVIKVEEHDKPGEKPFGEVKDQIRDKLMTEQAKTEFQTWVDKDLVKQHYVETMN
ncbi:MAG: peptidylprolyl isomerase [Candidatus Binataceae bacterium]